uniref:Cytospin-A n=1 Tax=Caenorhabditis tropicalis TaxID=1561998 RepID=A0A1I7U933_9PELO
MSGGKTNETQSVFSTTSTTLTTATTLTTFFSTPSESNELFAQMRRVSSLSNDVPGSSERDRPITVSTIRVSSSLTNAVPPPPKRFRPSTSTVSTDQEDQLFGQLCSTLGMSEVVSSGPESVHIPTATATTTASSTPPETHELLAQMSHVSSMANDVARSSDRGQ